jgi:hypothetical protein
MIYTNSTRTVPQAVDAIAYAMVNERMRLFDSNIAEPYHSPRYNNKWHQRVEVPRVHELKRYANKHVDTVGWRFEQRCKRVLYTCWWDLSVHRLEVQEYAQNRTVPHRHASHIQLTPSSSPQASPSTMIHGWSDELAHLTMMYMFVTLWNMRHQL